MRSLLAAISVAFAIHALPAQAQEADIFNGEALYKKCSTCHRLGEDAKHRVGPHLNDIVNQSVGRFEDYRYSKAMEAVAETGAVWDYAFLDAFLEDPRNTIPKTKMSFRGISSAKDRLDLIAFLESYSEAEIAPQGFEVSTEILAVEGDFAYGEYLSSECVACHSSAGDDQGIPAILGWPEEDFVTAMHAYKTNFREHPVMQMIAGRLSDEEIASLALYFNQNQ